MNLLNAPLRELAEFERVQDILRKNTGAVEITGCVESQKLHFISGLSGDYDVKLIVTYDELKAKEIVQDYSFYDKSVCYYPAKDLIFYQADVFGNRITTERMRVIRRILEGKSITIVTTIDSFMHPVIPLDVYEKNTLSLQKGAVTEEAAIAYRLSAMGYQNVHQVEEPGQFSIRGGIIDVFDLTEENPYRIELWGDEVDSIRSFDVLSQRSVEKLRSITVYPAVEMFVTDSILQEGLKRIEKDAKNNEKVLRDDVKTEEAYRVKKQFEELKEQIVEFKNHCNLESYILYFYPEAGKLLDLFANRKICIFMDEISKVDAHGRTVEAEFADSMSHRAEKGYVLPGQMKILQPLKKAYGDLQKLPLVSMSVLDFVKSPIRFTERIPLQVISVSPYNSNVAQLMKDLKHFKKKGYRVLVISSSRTRAKRLAADITDEGVQAFYSENKDRELQPGEIMTLYGRARQGFEYPLIRFVVLCDTDIFGAERKKKKKKVSAYSGQKIKDFAELKVGDYVVHENYGMGIYRGIDKITTDGVTKDYMKIEYRDGANLYVLATAFDLIQKYASADAKKPKINKLGTQEWHKTKSKVRQAVAGVAKELVELYAKRQQTQGYRYAKDTVWQKEFEELFPYEETEDQLAAIEATKADMESGKIMERLICGDVGYGKTEIAIRAAFKAVMEGKQVVYLVPTTILAQQHYNTFAQRMKDFPIRVELLCRFRTNAQNKKTIDDLKKGMIDIVVGTHRVLSDDVALKDLGLLIIDEEQRFGVAHKEKIKKLREDVDVLTLTATPIPRTLHMSLIGIRDMSILEEPPQDRLPIQTFVMEFNEEMVREAIVREMTRNGQVYYVYNRISDIDDVAAMISRLVPEARVAYAHGQMHEKVLEQIMYDFINGEIDVLVSTTIIETGLDISNVNTMIIHDSDRLGLSQLYQLRGRVGRSNKTAYAFLMYRKDKMLKEVAEKRLQAIREFTELGSGFKISMRDLEIRGAGNILGMKQHGHMEAVGYELYCKMLNAEVMKQKGETVQEDFETLVDLDVDAYIPMEYIVNEVQKLEMYQRIAMIEGKTDAEQVEEELLDRFGTIPKPAAHLLRISLIRSKAHRMYVTEIKGSFGKIKITVKQDAPVKTENLEGFLSQYKGKMRFITAGGPGFEYKYEKDGLIEKDEVLLLEKTEQLLCDMEVLF